MVGRGDVDPSILQRLAIRRVRGTETAGAGENLRKIASATGDVEDDEDRRLQVLRQIADDTADRLYAAR
jgi:hypothetical protein